MAEEAAQQKLMKEHQDAMRAARLEHAKEPKAGVFDM